MKHPNSLYKISGLSLLELMLVAAVATSIFLMGLRFYRSFETQKDYYFLKANVDLLFQAMKGYYQQECDLHFSRDGSIIGKGALTYNSGGGGLVPVSFDVTKVNQFISVPWPRNLPMVASGSANTVYFAQFNPSNITNKKVYVCSSYTTGTPQCDTPIPIPGSNVILWQSQIAVKMQDPTKTTYYLALAGADCAVNNVPTDTAVDCSTGVTIGNSATYMVWQRMPSFSSMNVRSSHWGSNPVVKEFKLQYTHDPMYELYNSNATPDDIYQYYYCGG